jgi:hypothetical protein
MGIEIALLFCALRTVDTRHAFLYPRHACRMRNGFVPEAGGIQYGPIELLPDFSRARARCDWQPPPFRVRGELLYRRVQSES